MDAGLPTFAIIGSAGPVHDGHMYRGGLHEYPSVAKPTVQDLEAKVVQLQAKIDQLEKSK